MKPTTSIDRFLLSTAAFLAAAALFAFALRGGEAQASPSSGSGQVGRYQLVISHDAIEYDIIDTTNGDVFSASAGTGMTWSPLEHQLRAR